MYEYFATKYDFCWHCYQVLLYMYILEAILIKKVYNDNLTLLVAFQNLKLPAETANGTWICLFKT